MPKEETNEKILGQLHQQVLALTKKLDSLYQLVEQLWHALSQEDDSEGEQSDASTVELDA